MLQNILREPKRLEDNCVNSSSSQTPGTQQAEELLLKWFVPRTFLSGHCWGQAAPAGRQAGSVWTKVGFEMSASGSRVFNTEPHSPIFLKRGAVGGIKSN